MNPIPLTDPNGVIRAWMCSACESIGEFNGGTTGWHVEESKLRAESCCVCECGAPMKRLDLECPACALKRRNEIEAARVEKSKTHDPCATCNGTGNYMDRFAIVDCDACAGTGWIAKEGAR